MLPYAPEKSYPSYAQLIVEVKDRDSIDPALAATRDLIRSEHLQAFAKVKRLMIGPSPAASIEARFSGRIPRCCASWA